MSYWDQAKEKSKEAGGGAVGGAIGGATPLGPYGAIAGSMGGMDVANQSSSWGDAGEKLGFGNRKANEIAGDMRGAGREEYDTLAGINNQMAGVGKNYLDSLNTAESGYQKDIKDLRSKASDQATNAQTTYNNAIRPGLMNAVEQSQKELYDPSGNPKYMTYLQAQDPNNAVAQSFRGFYDTQAQNEGKSGLADVGIMSNLGAQAMQNQMGGMAGAPMTGAQMQMMQGQNMSQAGQAMANVQKRQQNLRDQGVQQGWLQTQAAYERGEGARDRQMKNISALQQGQGQNIAQQQGLRGEMGGYSTDTMNSQGRQNEGAANVGMGNLQRSAGLVSGRAAMERGFDVSALQNANNKSGTLAGGLQGLAGAVGGVLGGGASAQGMSNAMGGGGGTAAPGAGVNQAQYPSSPAAGGFWGNMFGGGGGTNAPQQQAAPQGATTPGGSPAQNTIGQQNQGVWQGAPGYGQYDQNQPSRLGGGGLMAMLG